MENENPNQQDNNPVQANPNETDYINEIQRYQRDYIPKTELERSKQENAKLIKALSNGEYFNKQKEQEEPVDLAAINKEMASGRLSNRAFVEKALQIRNEKLKEGIDVFLPTNANHIGAPSSENSNAVAAVFQDCLDYAQGDDQLFIQRLNSWMTEGNPVYSRR